ncbi:MAG TPA: hypothetical protein VNQ73_16600 [Ilumatobacter sp.]|nr:hypothetical protein [Ilumatobacter sp.]
MRPPDLLRSRYRLAPWVAAAAVLAGCSNATDTPAATTTTAHTSPSIAGRGDADLTPTATATNGRGDDAVLAVEPAARIVTVSGGDLPAEITDAYRAGGGDLVDPAEWAARYGTAGLPELVGPGVRLVEATHRADHSPAGWARVDEAAWLAVATADRDELLAELAAAAGVDGSADRTPGTDNGGDCATDTYPPDPVGVVWTVQGCSYPRYPQMVAVGVTRRGPTSAPPEVVDPTVGPLVELLDGQVGFVEVRLGAPGPDTATLHISVHVTRPAGTPTDAADALLGGPLAGWQVLRGEGSVLLSGPTGATWTLADGVAVFDWAGRW